MILTDISADVVKGKNVAVLGYRTALKFSLFVFILIGLTMPCAAQNGNKATSKTVIFGARTDAAPFSYWDGENWRGYTIELCHKIFKQYKTDLGDDTLELLIVPVSAAERFTALRENRIQALCGATTVTIQRMREHHFTLLIYLSGASVMKRRDTKVEALMHPKDQEKKIKVSVVEHTTTKDHVESLLGTSVETIKKENHQEAFLALQQREVEFYFGDRSILRERLRNSSDQDNFILAPGFLSYEPYAIAVRKENHELLNAANAALAELYRSGKIYGIYRDWFGNAEMSELLKAMYELQKIPDQ